MKRIRPVLYAALASLAILLCGVIELKAEPPSAEDLVKEYFAAGDASGRSAALEKIETGGILPGAVARALPKRKKFEPVELVNGEFVHEFNEKDRVNLFVPDTYDGTEPFGLIIHLFGAGGFENTAAYRWAQTAGEKDYILLTPYRDMGFHPSIGRNYGESRWWEEDVAKFVRKCVEYALNEFNVDPDRVYLSGFSNGAHGVWSIASYWPDMISAATAHCGSPAIHYVYGYPMYISNLGNLALDLRMGGRDRQDWRTVQHCAKLLKEMGADANFVLEQERSHRWMSDKAEEILEWFGKTHRVLYPEKVSLRARSTDFGKAYWLRIDEIGDCGNNAEFEKDWSGEVLKLRGSGASSGPKMGFMHNQQYEGDGVQVARVLDNTPAANSGLEAGDIIKKVGGHNVRSIQGLRDALSNFKLKDKTTVTIDRDGEELRLDITFTEIKQPQRPARPGMPQPKPFPFESARVTATIDNANGIIIEASQVKKLTVFLHKDMGLDLSQPVSIKLNGKEVFAGAVTENVETLLEHARVYHDVKRVFTAAVEIDVAAGTRKSINGIGKVTPSKIEDEPEKEKPEEKPAEKVKEEKKPEDEEKPEPEKEQEEEKEEDDGWR